MRQTALIILCVVLPVVFMAGCGAEDDAPENKPDNPPAATPPAETPSTEAPTEDDADAPRVTSTEPVNGKNDVDPATTDIVVKFSEDMLGMAALLERVDGFEYPENT
ncbi:MAG: Ig-like domain-containing protein, partial [Planctomycetota bacterium]